jgi:phage FluMu protein Com
MKNPPSLNGQIPEELKVRVKEYHCANCGRFLCFQAILEGTIAIKCKRCKEWNVLNIESTEEVLTKVLTSGSISD